MPRRFALTDGLIPSLCFYMCVHVRMYMGTYVCVCVQFSKLETSWSGSLRQLAYDSHLASALRGRERMLDEG